MGQGPTEYCDLVMKGGITSGVIYPAAAYELSEKYSFKNIGGTSAGAIAAAVVAAAELGRRTGAGSDSDKKGGFDIVKGLSSEIASNGKLLKLFTPDKKTSKIFVVALNVLGQRSTGGKIAAGLGGVLFAAWFLSALLFTIGLFLPTELFVLAKWHSLSPTQQLVATHPWVCFLSGILVGLALALIGSTCSGAIRTIHSLAANSFGMCSGMARASDDDASLTEWLDEQIQAAAGRTSNQAPVTFGDLWNAPLYDKELLKTPLTIQLQVVTTSVTEGRPYSIPFRSGTLYFDPSELAHLFPERIIQSLIVAAERFKKKKAAEALIKPPSRVYRSVSSPSSDEKMLVRLPDPEDLPILVATRMSLSFPALLSAVPFYRVDGTVERNQDKGAAKYPTRVGTKIWFSDGGICSNFPINFFDSPIPRWPTFGINLTSAPADKCKQGKERAKRPAKNFVSMLGPDEAARVPMNDLGDLVWTSTARIEQKKALDCIGRFVLGILNTTMDWRDNLQAVAPGYRDRIASVQLCPDEGGLNLNMPDSLIEDLTARGQLCGQMLKGFDFSQHAFTRYRIALSGLEEYLLGMDRGYQNPVAQDEEGWEYIKAEKIPPHYHWPKESSLAQDAAKAIDQIHELLVLWEGGTSADHTRFSNKAPKPKSTLQSRPDF